MEELEKIRNTRPNDRVVVGVDRKPGAAILKGYKKIEFPAVPL